MSKILILTPLPQYGDNIESLDSYNYVVTFFIKKYLERLGNQCTVVAAEDAFTVKHVSKSNYATFKRLVEDPGLLQTHDAVIILGIKSLRSCDYRIIDLLKTKGKTKVLELDETARRPNLEFTCMFMVPGEETVDTRFIGQGVDLDYLYPEKSDSTLVVHVDHPWTASSRADYFDRVQEKLRELVESNVYKKYGFNDLEIIYHTIPVTDISTIDNSLIPPNVPFTELAKIYRQSHIAFISHAESMGNYPLELAATGATVILPANKSVPNAVMALIKFEDINIDNFWGTILAGLKETQEENIKRAKEFSYENVAKRIMQILGEL